MQQFKLALGGLAVLAGLFVACGHESSSPTSPTAAQPGGAAASSTAASGLNQPAATGADGSTLKATAPTLVSPLNDVKLEERPTLVANPATLKFSEGTLQYRFQVINEGGVVVYDSGPVATTTHVVTGDLDFEKRHTWRVRAELQGAGGPWSNSGSFITAAGAYLRGNELRDPLTNGRTIGTGVDVTFLPGVGVMLNGRSSFVEWTLQTPLEAGEFSAIMTNIGEGSEEWKTKVMSMLQGDGVNITDNLYRVTIDKRTLWANQGARIRYTIRVGDDSEEVAGGGQDWSSKQIYFWKFEWGNGLSRLRVFEGGANGPLKEDLSADYDGVYRPNPHVIRLGSVGGRGGDDTNPLTVVRNVWVSSRPRPVFPGDN
jgi:hypothetical protein